jgi:hypothetical protein
MLIDIPLGKAVVPVKVRHNCSTRCIFNGMCWMVACTADKRKDGQNVQYKLVNDPRKKKEAGNG